MEWDAETGKLPSPSLSSYQQSDDSPDALSDTDNSQPLRSWFTIPLIISCVLTGGALMISSSSSYLPSLSQSLALVQVDPKNSPDKAKLSSMAYTLKRQGYDPIQYFEAERKSYLSDTFLTSYAAVVEPYASMLFHLHSTDANYNNDEYTYQFKVCTSSDTCSDGSYNPSDGTATPVKVACAPYDKLSIQVDEYDSNGSIVRSNSDSAVCMYVRREISLLTEDHLSDAMEAMYSLWKYSDEEGKAKFGSSFKSAVYFSKAHDFNAAQQDADHIHEGLGFLFQHIKLTNMFEAAVQVVDPSFAMPYWDFTKDVAAGKSIFDSMIFTEKTFGSITPPKDSFWGFTYRDDSLLDTAIQNGRWSHIKADKNVFDGLNNGFGYMRGPWNTNPSPYVSRFSAYSPSLPSCTDYYGGLGMPFFQDTLKSAPYGAHASTHGVIGAVYGCDKLDPVREAGIILDEDSQLAICKKWGFYMKELYRANYIAPRTDCTMSDSLEYDSIDCGFVCNADLYDVMPRELKTTIASKYLKSGVADYEMNLFRDFICEGDGSRIFVGDHLESASPSDPSFWVIHPTQERLFQAKLLIHSFTDITTAKWPTDASGSDYVCDKPKCMMNGVKDYYSSCCYGHFEYDQLLDFESGDRTKGIGPTNHDIKLGIDLSMPTYSMTYIYDNFLWPHCSEDFEGKLVSQYTLSSSAMKSAGGAVPTLSVDSGAMKSGAKGSSNSRTSTLNKSH